MKKIDLIPARTQRLAWTGAASEWKRDVRLEPVFVLELDGAEVTANFLPRMPDCQPENVGHFPLSEPGARRVYPELDRLNEGELQPIDVPSAALLCGGPHGADSYWHWTIDYLPRLWAYEQAGVPASVPLLVNADLAPFQVEMLGVYAGGRAYIRKEAGARRSVPKIYASSFLSRTGVVYPEAIVFLRRALREIDIPAGAAERVYLSRVGTPRRDHDQRALAQEMNLEARLRSQGFDILRGHEITFAQQVQAIGGARLVVAPHGAAMANLAFAPPGATVIEIATKPRHTLGPSMCAACGHGHRHVAPSGDLIADVLKAVEAAP